MEKTYLVTFDFHADDDERHNTKICKTIEQAKSTLRNFVLQEQDNLETCVVFCGDVEVYEYEYNETYFHIVSENFTMTITIEEKNIENKETSNKEKVFEFIKNNNKTTSEILDFCEENNIDYAYFCDIEELFSYYDEEEYLSFSHNIIDIIGKDGDFIKILN